jgi:hypothetical protein
MAQTGQEVKFQDVMRDLEKFTSKSTFTKLSKFSKGVASTYWFSHSN